MTQYIFKQNIAGSNDGIEVVEYAKGSIVEGSQLSEYLTEKWLKSGVIELLKPEQEEEKEGKSETEEPEEELEEIPEEVKTENETETETSETGDEEVDDFLNGKTDEVPEGTEEISEENALILEAKELLKPEQEEEINSDRLKEIGVALNIPKMSNTVNPAKIIEKIRKFIEEYDAEKEKAE